MLQLVLNDEPDDEPAVEQRVVAVQRELRQELEHGSAHVCHVGARLLRSEQRELRTLRPAVRKGVVELVELRQHRGASPGAPQQPELLVVRDMGEVPDERRLQRRDRLRQLRVSERREQRFGARTRARERGKELRE